MNLHTRYSLAAISALPLAWHHRMPFPALPHNNDLSIPDWLSQPCDFSLACVSAEEVSTKYAQTGHGERLVQPHLQYSTRVKHREWGIPPLEQSHRAIPIRSPRYIVAIRGIEYMMLPYSKIHAMSYLWPLPAHRHSKLEPVPISPAKTQRRPRPCTADVRPCRATLNRRLIRAWIKQRCIRALDKHVHKLLIDVRTVNNVRRNVALCRGIKKHQHAIDITTLAIARALLPPLP